jgi:hypothetical protein
VLPYIVGGSLAVLVIVVGQVIGTGLYYLTHGEG